MDEEQGEAATDQTALTPTELATVRDLALRAHPDTVPELVSGTTVAEVLASVEPARAAYQRIAQAATAITPPVVPVVPAGSAPAVVIDPVTLSPAEKIRRGLATRIASPAGHVG